MQSRILNWSCLFLSAYDNPIPGNAYGNHYYVGLQETAGRVPGTWQWLDGTPLHYNRWMPGEPNHAGARVALLDLGTYELEDINGRRKYPFICEIDL